MSAWRIVALGPTAPVERAQWRDAADAADLLAAEQNQLFELLLVGTDLPSGTGWDMLGQLTLARTADAPDTAAQIAAVAADMLAKEKAPLIVLAPPGPFGEEIAADLAVRLGGRALGRARTIVLSDGVRASRSVFGGRAELVVSYPAGPVTAAMRAERAVSDRCLPVPTIVDVGLQASGLAIDRAAAADRDIPLEGARLILSGGRGLDEAGFALLGEIAASIGGAVGGSLPAVDAGLVPVSRQVGQSGKFVAPDLYVAVGLSGTPQHLAGIGAATRLIAINSDPAAPIFSYAELGALADARELLPLLRDALVE